MKVIIVGNGEMLMNLTAGCEDAGCEIVGVLRSERSRMSCLKQFFKNSINPSKDFTYLQSHNIRELKSKSVNSKQFKKEIVTLDADIVLVGSWGEKFKKEIIDLPKMCTINVHPSLLPKYRGPNPYIEVIKNGEKETGVTFHLMTEQFDAGPILMQKKTDVLENDTGKELKTRVTNAAREGIKELLQQLDSDIIIPLEQNESLATYYKKIETKDLLIDFKQSADKVSAKIRALYPFAKACFSHNSHFLVPNPYKLKIVENKTNAPCSTIYETNPKLRKISVVCGDGNVLEMTDVKLFGILNIISDIYIKLRIKVGKKV
ncbi:methionyl-tRNA formyltransferase [bacterium]|nr:methionyl-tRNA formyltransferase [bacterium]